MESRIRKSTKPQFPKNREKDRYIGIDALRAQPSPLSCNEVPGGQPNEHLSVSLNYRPRFSREPGSVIHPLTNYLLAKSHRIPFSHPHGMPKTGTSHTYKTNKYNLDKLHIRCDFNFYHHISTKQLLFRIFCEM